MLLDDTTSCLDLIKASHTKNQTTCQHIDDLPRLDDFLAENAEVKLSSRHVPFVDDIYVSSSPISSDSP